MNESNSLDLLREVSEQYGRLHDLISDFIESGDFPAKEFPSDYAKIVAQLTNCVPVDQRITEYLSSAQQ